MKKIKDIISKPSEALEAMVKGLEKYSKHKKFRIEMMTFGQVKEGICYGCAATCTVLTLTGTQIYPKRWEKKLEDDTWSSHGDLFSLDKDDIASFETSINFVRYGTLEELFKYFEVSIDHLDYKTLKILELRDNDGILSTSNWESKIYLIKDKIKELKQLNY